ncbi:MAG: HDOD domain-containing protein [Pirellulales bacterium]|nr:HDOD domain-containing protein [Pirellulales bacterium]
MGNAIEALNLDEILKGGQLPALPQSAINLLQLSKDPNIGPAEFAVPIEADPGLTSQVLKFVNSSYFGFSREISSVRQAITLVGMRTIKNFALWSAVFSLMPNPSCGAFDLRCLWQDSLRRALFAKAFALRLKSKEAEEPFAAALLQDMAVPLLAKQYPAEYAELFESRANGKVRLSQLEQDKFGYSHAEVAACMCRQWSLPETIASLIEQHTKADELVPKASTLPNETAVALSAMLPASHDENWEECGQLDDYCRRATESSLDVPELLAQVDSDFDEIAPILKVSPPKQTLVDSYRQYFENCSS